MITKSFRRLVFFALAGSLPWAMHTQADTSAHSFTVEKPPTERGFLVEKYRDQLRAAPHEEDSWLSRLCDYSTREASTACPDSLPAPSTFADLDTLTTGAPNLRLRIVLTSMQNTIVAGSGIDSPSFEEALITWKFESLDADESIPALTAEPFGLFAPLPGTTIEAASNHANGLYQGLIINGCIGTPATYALTLNSEAIRANGDPLGAYTGSDEVVGWGWNGLDYSVHATDPEGNSSDFRVRGVAYADCVFDDSLAQQTSVENKLSLASANRYQDKTDSRYISAIEVEQARGRYTVNVPGIGEFPILSVTSKVKTKSCLVDRESLVREITDLGIIPGTQGGKTREILMKGTPGDNGVTICSGSGEGCKVLVPVWDPDDPILPE